MDREEALTKIQSRIGRLDMKNQEPATSQCEAHLFMSENSSRQQQLKQMSYDDLIDQIMRLQLTNFDLECRVNLESSRRKRLEVEHLDLKSETGTLHEELLALRESNRHLYEKAESLAEERDDLRTRLQGIESFGIKTRDGLHHEELKDLRETIKRLCERAETFAEQRDDLRAKLEARTSVETQLQDQAKREAEVLKKGMSAQKEEIERLSLKLVQTTQDTDTSKKELEQLQEQRGNLEMFAKLGVDIRSRLLEWENKSPSSGPRNQSLIDAGTHCAHFGMAHTDAILYTPEVTEIYPRASPRKDIGVFIDLYGCPPLEILKYKEVERLQKVLNMRCTMKVYLIPDDYDTSKFKGHFKDAWVLLRNRKDRSIEGTKNLFEQKAMKRHLAAMEREHAAALAENKRKRSQMKQKERSGSYGGYVTPKKSSKTACYNCGEEGHLARDCWAG